MSHFTKVYDKKLQHTQFMHLTHLWDVVHYCIHLLSFAVIEPVSAESKVIISKDNNLAMPKLFADISLEEIDILLSRQQVDIINLLVTFFVIKWNIILITKKKNQVLSCLVLFQMSMGFSTISFLVVVCSDITQKYTIQTLI